MSGLHGGLDAFLQGAKPAAEAEPSPQAAPEPPPAAAEPTGEPQAQPAAEPAGEATEGATPAHEGTDTRTVPLSAFEKARNDWKSKAVKAETERDELRRQLEEARKAPQTPAAPPPTLAPIDPAQDPQGYHARIQGVMLNERLNVSELLLRKEIGSEAVDALVAEFKTEAEKDPSLYQKMYANPHPYEFVQKQMERTRLMRDLGDDPAAYRERIRAELAAEMANGTAPMPPVSPAAGLQPSLANVRSAAPRGAPAFSGPPSLGDIVRREPRPR